MGHLGPFWDIVCDFRQFGAILANGEIDYNYGPFVGPIFTSALELKLMKKKLKHDLDHQML